MNNKSQTQLIFNVILGLILLVIIFLIFWFISGRLKAMGEGKATDLQLLSVYDTYVPMLGIMNSSLLDDFVEIMKRVESNEGYLGNNKMFKLYRTFGDDVTEKSMDLFRERLNIQDIRPQVKQSYVTFLGPEKELRSFEMFMLFFSLFRDTRCTIIIRSEQWIPGRDPFFTNFCRVKEVVNE
jgi:hypothetical protein